MSLEERYPAYGGRGPGDLRLGLGLGAVGTIFMALRVYVRLRVNKFGTTALIWALVAWLLTTVTQSLAVVSILHGLGNRIVEVEAAGQLHNYLLFTWTTVFFFNLAIPTGKVAVAAFLIEMNSQGSMFMSPINCILGICAGTISDQFFSTDPKIRRSLIAVAAINIIFSIPQIILPWFQCKPPNALWNPALQDQCNPLASVRYSYFIGAVAALSDFYLAIIPITMLAPLKIDRKLKWGLSFLMGLGVFAGAAAIVRTWAVKFIISDDPSYGVGILFRWGEVEEWIVLITMSIPPVWPLFRPITRRFIKSAGYSRSPKNYQAYDKYASTREGLATSGQTPVVTTTISVSSVKGASGTTEPVRASSSADSYSGYDEETPETPHFALRNTGDPEGWVEMSHYRNHPH